MNEEKTTNEEKDVIVNDFDDIENIVTLFGIALIVLVLTSLVMSIVIFFSL